MYQIQHYVHNPARCTALALHSSGAPRGAGGPPPPHKKFWGAGPPMKSWRGQGPLLNINRP